MDNLQLPCDNIIFNVETADQEHWNTEEEEEEDDDEADTGTKHCVVVDNLQLPCDNIKKKKPTRSILTLPFTQNC